MVELVHPQEFDPEWEMRQAALAAEISRLDVPLTPQLLHLLLLHLNTFTATRHERESIQ